MPEIDSTFLPFLERVPQRRMLDNGLTVLVQADASSNVASVQAWVKTGSIHEGDHLGTGLSHFLEHMLFKGTQKRDGKQISRAVQSLGGYINAYTTFDRTVYYIDAPGENALGALEILGDAVFNSTLPADEVESERQVILREIDMGMDDPDHRLSRNLFESAYRKHPYRYPVIGFRELFEEVSRETLVNYYQSRYCPNNTVLVVVGQVVPEAVFAEAEKLFGGLRRKALKDIYIPEEPPQWQTRKLDALAEVNVTRLGLGFRVPGIAHEDAPGLNLLSAILGNGESSILWQRLRESRRVVHQVDTSCWNPGSSGLLWVSMVVDPAKKDAALAAFWEEINSIKDQLFDEALLEKVRRQALVSEVNARKTMGGQAGRIGMAEVVVGDQGYSRSYLEKLFAVTPGNLQLLMQKYLVPSQLTQVGIHPKGTDLSCDDAALSASTENRFDESRLHNGLRLLWQENHQLPKVHLRWVQLGGPMFEDPDRRGASGILATLLLRDTAKRTATEVATAIESVGGVFKEFSGNNTFGFQIEVLPQDLELALDLLEQALFYPRFDQLSFDREVEGQIASIREANDDIVEYGISELRKAFFGDIPYAVDADGREEDLAKLTREELISLHKRVFVGSNCVLSVAGSFDRQEVEQQLSDLLTKVPEGTLEFDNLRADKPAEGGRVSLVQDRKQAVVFQAYPGVGVRDNEAMALAGVVDEWLSGMSSRLFERVRDELGLAYYVGSSRVIGLDTGMFYLYGGTRPDATDTVLKEMRLELDRLAEGEFSDEDLARIKVRLKAQQRMAQQTIGARAMQAALNCLYGLPVNDWEGYDQRIDAVSKSGIQRFVSTYLRPENQLELIVGPQP